MKCEGTRAAGSARVARNLWLSLLSIVSLSFACGGDESPVSPAAVEDDFAVPPFVFHPTESSAVVSFVPESDRWFQLHYGEAGGDLDGSSEVVRGAKGQRHEFKLAGLRAGTRYAFELRHRGSDEELWQPGVGRKFRTARAKGVSGWSFAIGGDDHSVAAWARADCGSKGHAEAGLLEAFSQTQRNMKRRGVDFYINAGDTSNTHGYVADGCTFRGRDVGKGTIGTAGRGSAFREAWARWAIWLRNNQVALDAMPLYLAMGNHDGEQSFGNAQGDCRYFQGHPKIGDTHLSSEAARLALFPNPAGVYDGHSSGAYYSFPWGSAEFFILDAHKFGVSGQGRPFDGSHSYPESADDWTLGEDQMRWLEGALRRSDRRFKFLVAHHLLGGMTTGNCYHYGRGSVNATDTGNSRGAFLGEQRKIQALMEETGAQVFALGHDHVALAAEKLNRDGSGTGVHYLTVGMLGYETPPSWVTHADFSQHADFNGDGVADYDEGDVDHGTPRDHGTVEKGYFNVTMHEAHAEFCYYRTRKASDPTNDSVEFCYRVNAEE